MWLPPDYYINATNDGFTNVSLGGISGLQKFINDSLHEYSEASFNEPDLLKNCAISITDTGSSVGSFDLSLNVSDYLDETNYKLVLTDTESDVWTNRFYLDSSYNLSDNSNIGIDNDSKTIDKDVITINDENNQIIIEPLPVNIDGG